MPPIRMGLEPRKFLNMGLRILYFPLEIGNFMSCNGKVVESSIYNVEFLLFEPRNMVCCSFTFNLCI